MYLGFNSETLPANQITDYVIRMVQPKLQAVPGVQKARAARARGSTRCAPGWIPANLPPTA